MKNVRETYFKKYLRDNKIIGETCNIVDDRLMDVLQKVYFMGISRAIEQPESSRKLYEQISEQHHLDY